MNTKLIYSYLEIKEENISQSLDLKKQNESQVISLKK